MEGVAEPAEDSSQRCPILCREIDFETMEEVSNKLPRGKPESCCADGIPRELRMALSSFGNDIEQRSVPCSEVNNLLHMLMNRWRGSWHWSQKS